MRALPSTTPDSPCTYAFITRDGKVSQETRVAAERGQRIRWTLLAGQHLGRNRDEDIVREGTVVGYARWEEGYGKVGGGLMDCIESPRKYPEQRFDFSVPVSSDAWEIIA